MATVMMGTGKTKMEICFFMNEFNIVHTEHFHASGISGKKRQDSMLCISSKLTWEESPSQKYVL